MNGAFFLNDDHFLFQNTLFMTELIQKIAHLVSQGAAGLKMTRHQKRKIDETHVEVLNGYFSIITLT